MFMSMSRPKHISEKEWKYALERAERAKRYALMFQSHAVGLVVEFPDSRYQDPVWQWENEVRGRFTNVVGGKLGAVSGSQLKGD